MAHFANIDDDNIVQTVIVVANNNCGGGDYPTSEPIGQAFLASLGFTGEWRQTSYNNNFRTRFAGQGMIFRADLDAFIAPQPYPSWTLDANNAWQPPTPMPTTGTYRWNEAELAWVAI